MKKTHRLPATPKPPTSPQTPAGPAAATAPAEIAPVLSAATQRLVDGIRGEFEDYVEGFSSLEADRSTVAPHFMRAFRAWEKDMGGTFVAFVRVLVPDVPEDREGYRAHPAYQAADYLRRLQARADQPEREVVPPEQRPKSPQVALAFLIATVMPVVDPKGTIWQAFVREMNWDDETATRIRERASKLGAVKLPSRAQHQLEGLSKAA